MKDNKVKVFNREVYNIILTHSARTWERIRVKQPHRELPSDNVVLTECIDEVSEIILYDDVIQEFIKTFEQDGEVWTRESRSTIDAHIGALAMKYVPIVGKRVQRITKANKVIAEFMDAQDHQVMGECVTPNYDCDWEELEKVVNKIKRTDLSREMVMQGMDELIDSFDTDLDKLFQEAKRVLNPYAYSLFDLQKIEDTYNAVVKFIEEYNKVKRNELQGL